MLNKIIASLLLGLVCFASPAYAAEVSIAPLKSELTVEQGREAEQELVYTNDATSAKKISVYIKPFYVQDNHLQPLFERNGVAYVSDIDQAVSVDTERFVVEPGAQTRVKLKVAANDVPVGQYRLAVFFEEEANPLLVPGGTQVRTNLAALTHINVAPAGEPVATAATTVWYRSSWFMLLAGICIAFVLIDIAYRIMRARKARSWDRIMA